MHIILTEDDIKPERKTVPGYEMAVTDSNLSQELIAQAETIGFLRRGMFTIMKNRKHSGLKVMTRIKASAYLESLAK